jgi:lysophospholipase L1-like esterase
VATGRLRNGVLGALSFLLVFFVLEGAVRVAFTVRDDFAADDAPEEYWMHSREMMWKLRPGFEGIDETGQPRAFDAQGFRSVDSAQVGSPSDLNVVFLGDSSTYGSSVATDETFAEVVDRMSPDISTINLGVPGYSSYQGYRGFLDRALPLEPDVIVVSFNYNDRRYLLAADQVDGAERFAQQFDALRPEPGMLEKIYLFRALRVVLRRFGVGRDAQADVGTIRLDETFARVSPADYRANLVGIIEAARERGIRVILLSMSDNPVQVEYLERGMEALDQALYDAAIDNLTIAVRLENSFSDLARLHLGRAYEMLGRVDEQVRTLTVTPFISLPGGTPIYSGARYNDIMREVAAEHGVELLEAAEVLAASRYLDQVHPDAEGHRLIGEALFERFLRAEAPQ